MSTESSSRITRSQLGARFGATEIDFFASRNANDVKEPVSRSESTGFPEIQNNHSRTRRQNWSKKTDSRLRARFGAAEVDFIASRSAWDVEELVPRSESTEKVELEHSFTDEDTNLV
jgi:hypothetical protein